MTIFEFSMSTYRRSNTLILGETRICPANLNWSDLCLVTAVDSVKPDKLTIMTFFHKIVIEFTSCSVFLFRYVKAQSILHTRPKWGYNTMWTGNRTIKAICCVSKYQYSGCVNIFPLSIMTWHKPENHWFTVPHWSIWQDAVLWKAEFFKL